MFPLLTFFFKKVDYVVGAYAIKVIANKVIKVKALNGPKVGMSIRPKKRSLAKVDLDEP